MVMKLHGFGGVLGGSLIPLKSELIPLKSGSSGTSALGVGVEAIFIILSSVKADETESTVRAMSCRIVVAYTRGVPSARLTWLVLAELRDCVSEGVVSECRASLVK